MIFATVFTAILAFAIIKYLFWDASNVAIDKEIKYLEEQKEFLEKVRQEMEEEKKTKD